MEVDMGSPSFRTARSSPSLTKRPRSPPSPSSSFERPSKRLSFGVNNSVSLPLSRLSHGVASPPAIQARQVSEDWVVQTRSLKIDRDRNSPQIDQTEFLTIVEEPSQADRSAEGEMVDECMTMDSDEPMSNAVCPPNSPAEMPMYTPSASTSNLSMTSHLLPPPQFPPHFSQQQQHISHEPHELQPQQPFFQHQFQQDPSQSSFQNASPAFHNPQQGSYDTHQSTCSSHLPEMNTQISHEPRSHSIPPVPPTPSRRQRFTMGPRADCEKCRMGVKGHWMHFD